MQIVTSSSTLARGQSGLRASRGKDMGMADVLLWLYCPDGIICYLLMMVPTCYWDVAPGRYLGNFFIAGNMPLTC